MRRLACLVLAFVSTAAIAQYEPPLGAHHAVGGGRTPMLTIGSTHLSAHTGTWKGEWTTPLVDALVAYRPGLITVEQLSGAQCEMMRGNPAVYAEVFDQYCMDASPYQRGLRMTQAQADAEATRQLANWPATPTPAQRRHLAALFLAAGETGSAMVQWLRLPPPERKAGDGLNEAGATLLSRPTGRLNETFDVAAQVAARVGLERLHSVDDHTSDAANFGTDEFGAWQQARYDALSAGTIGKRNRDAEATVRDGASLLAYYRLLNAPHAVDDQLEGDFGGAFADAHPKRFGRMYGAWWETRNLRMMSNIREAMVLQPGVSVLNIVGSSHKAWYDAWARQMTDVDVVDATKVLGH